MKSSDKYYVIEIPFISKSILNKILGNKLHGAKYSFKGIVKYYLNKDFFVIKETFSFTIDNIIYRPNDPAMMNKNGKNESGTSFWKNWGELRKEIFLSSKNNNECLTSTSEMIQKLNDNSFKFNTLNTFIQFVQGSNISGADTNYNANPIVIDLDYLNYGGYRFVNAIKTIKNSDIFFNPNKHSLIKENLDFLITKNEIFANWFDAINYINNSNINEYIKVLNASTLDTSNIDIQTTIYKLKNNLASKKRTVAKLRNIFKFDLLREALDNNIDEYTNSGIKKQFLEGAHIIQVKDILKNNLDLKLIADKDNGLLLEPTIHDLYDRNIISFDKKGNLIKNEIYGNKDIHNLLNKILTTKRIRNLEYRNNHLIFNDKI